MDALALCKIETVEVAIGSTRRPRVERVTAHRYLDFAIYRVDTNDLFRDRWRAIHLPTGRCVADGFSHIEVACAAMIEIARLRNDWACITETETTREVALKVRTVIKKHDPRAWLGDGRDGHPFKIKNLNGYSPTPHQANAGE